MSVYALNIEYQWYGLLISNLNLKSRKSLETLLSKPKELQI